MQSPNVPDNLKKKMLVLHFSTENCAEVTCRDCIDYRIKQCPGRNYSGQQCLACMEKHLAESHPMLLQ